MADTQPVDDWESDCDIFDDRYVVDPVPVWRDLRGGRCPIAHSDRWGGSWLPPKYADVQAMSKMVPELSSRAVLVVPLPEAVLSDPNFQKYGANSPPISADPPEHSWTRRLLLPHFSPKAVEDHRQYTEDLCERLIDRFIADGNADAVGDYAQQIPPRVIAHMLGIDRCAGSNLARMEMDVALRTLMRRIPEFEVSAPDEVTWAGGQVRCPRHLPVRFPT